MLQIKRKMKLHSVGFTHAQDVIVQEKACGRDGFSMPFLLTED